MPPNIFCSYVELERRPLSTSIVPRTWGRLRRRTIWWNKRRSSNSQSTESDTSFIVLVPMQEETHVHENTKVWLLSSLCHLYSWTYNGDNLQYLNIDFGKNGQAIIQVLSKLIILSKYSTTIIHTQHKSF